MNLNLGLKSDRICRSITGMSVYQFNQLVIQFEWNYLEYQKKQQEKREKERIKKIHLKENQEVGDRMVLKIPSKCFCSFNLSKGLSYI